VFFQENIEIRIGSEGILFRMPNNHLERIIAGLKWSCMHSSR